MIIDWLKFAPALAFLLVPIGLFHGKKVRFRPITRDWADHWGQILTFGLHWIDLGRAIIGGWLLIEALTLATGAAGVMRYSVILIQATIVIVSVCVQTFVCKERDSAHAPFMFITGLLCGLYSPATAGFPILLALIVAAGTRIPVAYFPALALALGGLGFLFDGRKAVMKLAIGCIAALMPWLFSLMFSRTLVLTYRAKRQTSGSESPLPPPR